MIFVLIYKNIYNKEEKRERRKIITTLIRHSDRKEK